MSDNTPQQIQPIDDSEMRDHSGAKSSKRRWAYNFGTTAIVVVGILVISAIVSLFIFNGRDLPSNFVELMKFIILTTMTSCLLALGLTIPEWFSKGMTVDGNRFNTNEQTINPVNQQNNTINNSGINKVNQSVTTPVIPISQQQVTPPVSVVKNYSM